MFTMNCTRHAKTPEELATAHKYLSVHSAGGYNVDTGAGMYFPTMRAHGASSATDCDP
jgi:hypothetical protein